MGIDIYFVTKTKNDNQLHKSLSRDFGYLVCGPGAYGESCELYQLEKILDLNLSLLLQSASLSPPTGELEYKLYVAKEENNLAKVELLQNQLVAFRVAWETNYPLDTDDWTSIEELEQLVLAFKNKLYAFPHYHQELRLNFEWDKYFLLQEPQNSWERRLYIDLSRLPKVFR